MSRQLPKKAEEMIYKLSLNRDFRLEIQKIREKHGIPAKGFSNREDIRKWFSRLKKGGYSKFLYSYDPVIKKYNLYDFDNLLESYIFHNLIPEKHFFPTKEEDFFCSWGSDKGYDRPSVHITIYPGASREYIIRYLTRHWKEIKAKLNNPRIRSTKDDNKIRNNLIFELWEQSREKLGLKPGEYRDIEISRKLKDEFDIKVSPDNIRKIASRMRAKVKSM